MNYWRRQTTDAIRGLTQERLTGQIESYNNGHLAEFSLTAEAMEQRDDVLKNVIAKRKKAVTRHGWEVLAENCSEEARAQQEALDYFYRNLTVSHVLRRNETGGFQLLIYQMMDALAKEYAVHEIMWKPQVRAKYEVRGSKSESKRPRMGTNEREMGVEGGGANGGFGFENSPLRALRMQGEREVQNGEGRVKNSVLGNDGGFPNGTMRGGFITQARSGTQWNGSLPNDGLTAEFRFVPLWYFEGTTGRLRFLASPGTLLGEAIKERDWLITLGDGLMIPCARAFLFKHAPLQAWLDYTSTYGLPGVRGITSALRGTPEFEQMEEALAKFMQELAVVTNSVESIDVLDLKGSGEAPFARLVDRMDRVMAALWRGADLSTISRDQGYGASLQEQESRLLEEDDARGLSDHLHATIDRWVIDALFGERTEILARIKILVSPQECTPHDLQVDEFLIRNGARLSLAATLERYGRVEAKADEPAISASAKDEVRRPKEREPQRHRDTEEVKSDMAT